MEKRTAVYDMHIKYGAKMVPFAGYLMPVQYKGIIDEIKNVRNNAGIFDVSHMGEIEIKGEKHKEFVNYITTNNVLSLKEYQVQYSMMLYENGGIVDDLLIYNLPGRILLVVNASNTQKDYDWIIKNKWDNIEVNNISDSITQFAIQGPKAQSIMQKLTSYNLNKIPFYYSAEIECADINLLISRTGYTGEDGFEVYFENKYAMDVYDKIMKAGEEFNIQPIGLGARDTLRMEMKYMLYGNDITEYTNPFEAGLSWVVYMNKDFIGKQALLKAKENGIKRRLVCFIMLEKGIPRHNYEIYKDNSKVGFVTSGNYSPSIDKYIGLGYINKPFHKIDTQIQIKIRNKILNARIIKPPFYKNGTVNPKKQEEK